MPTIAPGKQATDKQDGEDDEEAKKDEGDEQDDDDDDDDDKRSYRSLCAGGICLRYADSDGGEGFMPAEFALLGLLESALPVEFRGPGEPGLASIALGIRALRRSGSPAAARALKRIEFALRELSADLVERTAPLRRLGRGARVEHRGNPRTLHLGSGLVLELYGGDPHQRTAVDRPEDAAVAVAALYQLAAELEALADATG